MSQIAGGNTAHSTMNRITYPQVKVDIEKSVNIKKILQK